MSKSLVSNTGTCGTEELLCEEEVLSEINALLCSKVELLCGTEELLWGIKVLFWLEVEPLEVLLDELLVVLLDEPLVVLLNELLEVPFDELPGLLLNELLCLLLVVSANCRACCPMILRSARLNTP